MVGMDLGISCEGSRGQRQGAHESARDQRGIPESAKVVETLLREKLEPRYSGAVCESSQLST